MTEQSLLRSSKERARFLISAPSRLVGELDYPGLLVGHAFPNPRDMAGWVSHGKSGSHSRHYYVISVECEVSSNGEPVQRFDPHQITDLASLWFGKRFDLHGWTEYSGHFWMPYRLYVAPIRMPDLGAYNHQPRKDLGIPLNWSELSAVMSLFSSDDPSTERFWRAVSMYATALRAYQEDGDVAFLHLVRGIEILASVLPEPADDKLFDRQTLRDLKGIHEKVGEGAAKRMRERCFQLGKRVRLAAAELTNDTFFTGSESDPRYPQVAWNRKRLDRAVKAAYGVRSYLVHEGISFSAWVDPLGGMLNEFQVGRLQVGGWPDKKSEIGKLLSQIPTFLGLERLVRFMTLRFAHLKLAPLHGGLG